MEIKDIEQILALLKRNEVTEFELNHDGTQIKLKRGVYDAPPVQIRTEVQPAIVGASNGQAPAAHAAPAEDSSFVKVESPIVGTFYRKPSPDSESFVREGDVVKKGATLCIVEAMKLMNEIESPCSGRVEKILLSDGHVVEFGEVLFLINPNV